jgi:predicted NUDIX family NTP pyrophosphohydrolase
MPNQSAGILLYRRRAGVVEVFLVHPGGPFWAKRDAGAWSIPKGEFEPGKDLLEAAKREFEEETGFTVEGTFTALQPVRQRGGKVVCAFAVEGDCDASAIRSNTFEMEWPPRSGKKRKFPEVDRAGWFTIVEAMERINEGQRGLVGEVGSTLEPQS